MINRCLLKMANEIIQKNHVLKNEIDAVINNSEEIEDEYDLLDAITKQMLHRYNDCENIVQKQKLYHRYKKCISDFESEYEWNADQELMGQLIYPIDDCKEVKLLKLLHDRDGVTTSTLCDELKLKPKYDKKCSLC